MRRHLLYVDAISFFVTTKCIDGENLHVFSKTRGVSMKFLGKM